MAKKLAKSPLASNIVNLRHSKNWSQAELAHRVGVHLNTIKNIEGSHNEGTHETRVAIAQALGVEISDLYLDRNATPPPADPNWQELARLVQHYSEASKDRRLLALYILSDQERYLAEYEASPGAIRIAAMLKKSL